MRFTELLARVKRRAGGIVIGPKFLFRDAVKSGRVIVGAHTYGAPSVRLWGADERVTIGKFTSIADDVRIIAGGNHHSDWVTTFPIFAKFGVPSKAGDASFSKGDVAIGSDVWIGTGATILSGVSVGDGAVIGAGTVISRDVRPYSIVVGNPAREVRRRFDDSVVDRLLAVRWWDWPLDRILAVNDLLSSADVDAFLQRAELDDVNRAT